ncbi:hypothetical protein [Actinomadura rayongensis]|uniref:Uncharacterized protein n=1 Tax=Actinomadura rayongensis TaxID=1429076 RepID=A0A6I4W5F8_9ACTN|nr:hypothetical protein [Actinomadura rayongensis]MXQ63990.1 hypothetical protein [Actinomadura rayongensis]
MTSTLGNQQPLGPWSPITVRADVRSTESAVAWLRIFAITRLEVVSNASL